MLVKINNDTKEFKSKMDKLKIRLDLKVTSKVAEFCVENYADLDDRNNKNMKEIEKLLQRLQIIAESIEAKEVADFEIKEALKFKD